MPVCAQRRNVYRACGKYYADRAEILKRKGILLNLSTDNRSDDERIVLTQPASKGSGKSVWVGG